MGDIANDVNVLFSSASWNSIRSRIADQDLVSTTKKDFSCDEAELFTELSQETPGMAKDLYLVDAILVWMKRKAIAAYVDQFRATLKRAQKAGGRIYLAASGSSYHAALTAAYFFNALAHIPVYPCNPGIFRSMYLSSLTDADILIGISQSGETKDLVDVFLEVKEKYPRVKRASLVNNESACPCSADPR